jgi:hypothetical protein
MPAPTEQSLGFIRMNQRGPGVRGFGRTLTFA